MDYLIELEIPAGTSAGDPQISALTLPRGTIREISLLFPPGCAGLAHVAIFLGNSQLWPSTPDRYYSGGDTLIEFPENYALADTWNYIECRGWNEDNSYSHTIMIRFTVLAEEIPSWARHIFGSLFKRR